MKTIAALVAGLLLSTMTFVAGLAIALTLLNIDEPEHKLDGSNTTALWSTAPVAVDKTAQAFERVPARPVARTEVATNAVASEEKVASPGKTATSARPLIDAAATTDRAAQDEMIDPVTTGAIDPSQPDSRDKVHEAQAAAHVAWCSRRYRSYNAETNTYRPYGGGRRDCRSPYSEVAGALPPTGSMETQDGVTADQPDSVDDPAVMEQASYDDGAAYADSDHIQSCFARYRSYRPEDNSYQPYDGGPRQQCR